MKDYKNYRILPVMSLNGQNMEYVVQVRHWLGIWIDIKIFDEGKDEAFAKQQAEELLDKLEEA